MKNQMIQRPSSEIKELADRLERFRDYKVGPILDEDSQKLIEGALENLGQLHTDLQSAGL